MELIRVENLKKGFENVKVLTDVSFTVNKGDVIAVIGPSGAGKSTMLRCIINLEKMDGGTVTVEGEDLIRDGNDLGFLLEEQGQGMPDFMERFTAALEYEGCHRLKEALDIAENLNCYDLMQADGIELYGKEELKKLGVFQDSTLQDCIDAAGFGEALLEQRGYRLNAAETTYIRRNDRKFQYLRTQPKQGWGMTMK